MPRIRDKYHAVRRPDATPPVAPQDRGYTPGGPVGAMHHDLAARLNDGEYEKWLLPPETRTPLEGAVHWMSLGAGVIALTGGVAIAGFILGLA